MVEETKAKSSPGRIRRGLRWLLAPLWNFVDRHTFALSIVAVILLFGLIYAAPFMIYDLGPGELGVRWYRFAGGTDTDPDHVLGEGIHIIAPWDRIYKYDARLQREEQDFDVLSTDGLPMSVRVAWRYAIVPSMAGYLQKYIGPNYRETIITPDIAERVRDVISVNRPDEIWSEHRVDIEKKILEAVRFKLKEQFALPGSGREIDFVRLEDVLLSGITLPQGVQDAVVRKQQANQEQQEWDYRLLKEKKEAERKKIEALGIRDFQDVVSNGLTDSYLRWRGIEATVDLAKSPNAKIVVIGNSSNGLPLILNGGDDAKVDVPGLPTGSRADIPVPGTASGSTAVKPPLRSNSPVGAGSGVMHPVPPTAAPAN